MATPLLPVPQVTFQPVRPTTHFNTFAVQVKYQQGNSSEPGNKLSSTLNEPLSQEGHK